MKKILITGKDSYIGTSVEKWLLKEPEKYSVDTLDVREATWKEHDFSKYDVVFHVAGIVHKKEKPEMKDLFLKVNRDLPIEIAKKSKIAGVSQFIFMSTMAVYGEVGKIGQEVIIDINTPVDPKSFYSLSKVEAELGINKLNDSCFKVVVLRPPMVYGPNCPGNYARLEKLVCKLPVFPLIENQRSMINIDKLSQSVKECIDEVSEGLRFPQDDKYLNTSMMVKELAVKNGKSIHLSKVTGLIIILIGKRINLINKIFGNLVYCIEASE